MFVFAVSGALAAGRKKMDVFGVAVVALVTALGGGTIRDVVLGRLPVFWVYDPVYILVAVGAALAMFLAGDLSRLSAKLLLVCDAFGLGLFTVLGCEVAMRNAEVASARAGWVIVILMGAMTGSAGGILRDVLCGEIPLVLRHEIYATASLLGGLVIVVLAAGGVNRPAVMLAGLGVALAVRLAAIHWHLSLPVFGGRDSRPR